MKKLISVSLPCRNEEENIEPIIEKIIEQFEKYLPEYDYQIQFSDNCSNDGTREILRKVCRDNHHIRAIFNVSSFSGSAYHSILQTEGECCIHMASDFQDPPELIPQFVREWEKGAKVVCGIKKSTQENKIMWKIRSLYYKLIVKYSAVPQIEHFTGFGLYDRDFIEIMRRLNDPIPTLRGVVAEYGFKVSKIDFVQPRRRKGKSSNNFYSLFEYAMRNFTTYTKAGLHMATFGGMVIACLSTIIGIVYFVLKLLFWERFPVGIAPILIGMFFLGAVQLFFIGLVGEYIININTRVINRPLVIEEERIGFSPDSEIKPDNISPYI